MTRRRFVDQRLQQMRAAAAGFAPDIEGAIGHWPGRERVVELAQPRDQLGVGAGEKIVECRWRRGAEIERQLTKHSRLMPKMRLRPQMALIAGPKTSMNSQ